MRNPRGVQLCMPPCKLVCSHAARQHPWERRSSLLFFRGASTGGRNLTDPQLSEAHPDLLDVKVSKEQYFICGAPQGWTITAQHGAAQRPT